MLGVFLARWLLFLVKGIFLAGAFLFAVRSSSKVRPLYRKLEPRENKIFLIQSYSPTQQNPIKSYLGLSRWADAEIEECMRLDCAFPEVFRCVSAAESECLYIRWSAVFMPKFQNELLLLWRVKWVRFIKSSFIALFDILQNHRSVPDFLVCLIFSSHFRLWNIRSKVDWLFFLSLTTVIYVYQFNPSLKDSFRIELQRQVCNKVSWKTFRRGWQSTVREHVTHWL